MLQCITSGTAAMEGADQNELEDGINLNISAKVIFQFLIDKNVFFLSITICFPLGIRNVIESLFDGKRLF